MSSTIVGSGGRVTGLAGEQAIGHFLRSRFCWVCTQCGFRASGQDATVFVTWQPPQGYRVSATCGECGHYHWFSAQQLLARAKGGA